MEKNFNYYSLHLCSRKRSFRNARNTTGTRYNIKQPPSSNVAANPRPKTIKELNKLQSTHTSSFIPIIKCVQQMYTQEPHPISHVIIVMDNNQGINFHVNGTGLNEIWPCLSIPISKIEG